MSTEALLLKLREMRGPPDPRHSDIEALLPNILKIFYRRIGTETADSSRAIQLLKDLIMLMAKELNMFPLCDSIYTEMIHNDTFYEAKVNHMIKLSDELSDPQAPYTVVSIAGAQSSEKSYLLNQLFGTDFPVMSAKEGRKQTTHGILISRCIRPSLLVLNVEGFDGRERGQDTSFEKQAALFALTTSDLLIVNISIHDIGREHGGGSSLFKTIFQERTKLPASLTKIIIVVRYYDGETPLDILEHDVMGSLEEMWACVHMGSKEPVVFKDYIEVNVVALPEKNSSGFRKEVRNLRKLLSESPIDLNRTVRVPANGFSVSSKMFWDEIKQNKRLDLPSHKVMIATVYCQQTVEEAIKYFASHKDYKLLRSQESPQGFKEAADILVESIMAWYDKETDMYDAAIREKERQKLKEEINKSLTKYCQNLIHKMREKMSEQFKNEFVMNMKTMGELALPEYRDQILHSYRDKFSNLCEELKLFDVEYLHKISGDLTLELQSYASYQILGVKEESVRKEVELARQKADKNIQEVQDKLKEVQLEGQRMKEEINRVKENQENELKVAREEAEREHQKLIEQHAKENKRIQEVEVLKKIKKELEDKQKGGGSSCTIL